jgi:hypothetical protein
MPSGMRGVSSAVRGAEERATNTGFFPKFMLRDGEAAIAKFLAIGGDDDPHIGMAQAHLKKGSYDWKPCFTSFDEEQGACQCRQLRPGEVLAPGSTEPVIEDGYEAKMQVGIYLWVYRVFFNAVPNFLAKAGGLPQWRLSDGALGFLNDHPSQDRYGGLRFLWEQNSPVVWMRGPDIDQAFPKRLQQLTALFGGNLSAKDVMIYQGS